MNCSIKIPYCKKRYNHAACARIRECQMEPMWNDHIPVKFKGQFLVSQWRVILLGQGYEQAGGISILRIPIGMVKTISEWSNAPYHSVNPRTFLIGQGSRILRLKRNEDLRRGTSPIRQKGQPVFVPAVFMSFPLSPVHNVKNCVHKLLNSPKELHINNKRLFI